MVGGRGPYRPVRLLSLLQPCHRRLAPPGGTAPYLGRMGEVCHAPELKVEVTCRTDRVEETVAAVKRAHPYEEPVINVIPLYRTGL